MWPFKKEKWYRKVIRKLKRLPFIVVLVGIAGYFIYHVIMGVVIALIAFGAAKFVWHKGRWL